MNNKLIKLISAFSAISIVLSVFASSVFARGWADMYIKFCQTRGVITGDENGDLLPDNRLTREQMVKMILQAFRVDCANATGADYLDISTDRWSYNYISKYQKYVIEKTEYFNPTEEVSREEFLAMTMIVAGFGDYKPQNIKKMKTRFSDFDEIDEKYLNYIAAGFEKNCVTGSDGKLRPKDKLTRAEACSMFYKTIFALHDKQSSYKGNEEEKPKEEVFEDKEIVSPYEDVMLVGEPEVTLEQAKAWAKKRGAAQIYIDAAELYWKYGEITGLRADILYAQAAKETNYGKYTGKVKPEQNNWAGIKKYGVNGDEPEDHEDFETPDDGVRGHFNHMCAYVGIEPVGVPHARYKSVKSLSWAGTVKTVQELGGKWCPDKNYGNSIIGDFIEPMKATKVN